MTKWAVKQYAGPALRAAQPRLAKACFELAQKAYPTGSPWREGTFLADQKMPQSVYFTVEQEGQLLGFLGTMQILDQVDITTVAVDPQFQQRGLAHAMFDQLKATLAAGTVLFLEVRQSNRPALFLYQKVGFSQISVRTDYYQDPLEDAILMKLVL